MTRPGIEESHDQTRVVNASVKHLRSVDADHERDRDHDQLGRWKHGNKGPCRKGAKRTLTRRLRESAEAMVGEHVGDEASAGVAKDALQLYQASRRDVGHSSPMVLGPLLTSCVLEAVGSFYTAEAARLGFASPDGRELVEMALKCSKQSNQSRAAALGIAEKLQKQDRDKNSETPDWWPTTGEEASDASPTTSRDPKPETASGGDSEPTTEVPR